MRMPADVIPIRSIDDRPERFWLLKLAIALLIGVIAAMPALAQSVRLTILHTNDIHGHILPFPYTEPGRSKVERASVGGAARRATLIRSLRQSIGNPVLLVDAGDLFTRGPFTTTYEGQPDVEAMNALGYELAAVGNNEFKGKDGIDAGDSLGAQQILLRVVKRSRFPWICANAHDEKGGFIEGVQPYVVREIEGVRIGFLGLTAPRSAGYPQTKGWTIGDPIAAAREWIPKARANCDILIAVTHLGVGLDSALVEGTTGLDAIVGGDSHTFLYNALLVPNAAGKMIPIVQDGEFGVNLGRFDLEFQRADSGWRLNDFKYQLIPVDSTIAEAPDVVRMLRRYVEPMLAEVGTIGQESIGRTPEERSSNTTLTIMNAIRQQTGANLAINPNGGGLYEVFRRTDVIRYDIFAIMPFRNNVVVANLSGSEIGRILREDSTAIISGNATGLDSSKQYTVAMVDFIARSLYAIPRAQLTQTGRDIRDVVMGYLRRQRK